MEICPLTKNFKCCTLISDLLLARESKLNGLLLVAMDLCKPYVLMSDRSAIFTDSRPVFKRLSASPCRHVTAYPEIEIDARSGAVGWNSPRAEHLPSSSNKNAPWRLVESALDKTIHTTYARLKCSKAGLSSIQYH